MKTTHTYSTCTGATVTGPAEEYEHLERKQLYTEELATTADAAPIELRHRRPGWSIQMKDER